MRTTVDLLELDFAFSQRTLLLPDQFINQYQRRESYFNRGLSAWKQLEVLHEAQMLVPMYHFVENRNTLKGNQYVDSRTEPFKSWPINTGQLQGPALWIDRFYYSPYQLLLFPILQNLVSLIKAHRTPRKPSGFDISYSLNLKNLNEDTKKYYENKVQENDELVFALTALEAKYYPRITGIVTNHNDQDLEAWFRYDQTFDPSETLCWLGWDSEKVWKSAEALLLTADSLDPLRDWISLARLCRFKKLEILRGDALVAIDYRVAAEMLLLFYEDLHRKGEAPPLGLAPKRFYDFRRNRLNSEREELNEVLMDFGISPHPSLILVLEGETEELIVPLVFDLLEIPLRDDHIKIFNARGVDRDFELLARYAATPELGEPVSSGFLFSRPPTHYFVVTDSERKFKGIKDREKQRKKWVKAIWKSIPKPKREQIAESEIASLVEVETWNTKGKIFEFSHFTNRQLAKSILNIYKGTSAPSLADLEMRVANIRKKLGKLDKLWENWNGERPTKVKLAEDLWPLLKKKITRALSRNTYRRIPVVRIALQADKRANQIHRYDVMIRGK